MTTLFISDLHLDPAGPDITSQSLVFLATETRDAEALYILGDLFEAWVGDDDPEPEKRRVIASLKQLTDAGLPCYFMHGNRDFLVGEGFAAASGFSLLADPTIVDLYGTRVMLMHGDTLCTDDHEYQAFRQEVRSPAWQQAMLSRPLPERLALAKQLRERRAASMAGKAEEIMDVNQGAVESAMREHGVCTLLLIGNSFSRRRQGWGLTGKQKAPEGRPMHEQVVWLCSFQRPDRGRCSLGTTSEESSHC